jgi:hypothetical protein
MTQETTAIRSHEITIMRMKTPMSLMAIILLLATQGRANAETIPLQCVYTAVNNATTAPLVGRRFNIEVSEKRLLIDNVDMEATVTIGETSISYRDIPAKGLGSTLQSQVTISRITGDYLEDLVELKTMEHKGDRRGKCEKRNLPAQKF